MKKDRVLHVVKEVVFWSILCTFVLGVVFGIYFMIKNDERIEKEMLAKVETREVKSCILTSESSSYISGAFILGCGGVYGGSYDDIQYYFYMKGEKGFGLQYVNAEYVEIVPIKEGTPYIEGHFDENGGIYHYIDGSDEFENKMKKYFLYIPAAYIVEEYSVNVSELQ